MNVQVLLILLSYTLIPIYDLSTTHMLIDNLAIFACKINVGWKCRRLSGMTSNGNCLVECLDARGRMEILIRLQS